MTFAFQVTYAQAPDINGTHPMTEEETKQMVEDMGEKMKEELDNELTEKLENMTDGKCIVCNMQSSTSFGLSEAKVIEISTFWGSVSGAVAGLAVIVIFTALVKKGIIVVRKPEYENSKRK